MTPRRMTKEEREASPTTAGRWVLVATGTLTALLLYTGLRDGEWRGVIVSEVQVLAVGLAAYWGLTR